MTMSNTHVSFAIRGHLIPFQRDVSDGDDFNLENATIQDFLEDVAEYHATQCGCLVNIGSHVWLVSDPLDEAAMRTEAPAATDALALETRLDSLRGPHTPNLRLLIDGEALEFGTNELLRLAREKRFIPFSHGAGTVFRRSGPTAVLPSENVPSYNSLCTTPGSVFVDKSAFVRRLLNRFISSHFNIIRRPRGFGKTTFLSMVDAYFDPQSPSAHFPFIFEPELMSESLFAARNQMLVFSMDFAKLSLHEDEGGDEVMNEDDVMDEDEQVDMVDEEEHMSDDDCASEADSMSEDEFPYEGTYVSDEAMGAKCDAFLDEAARAFYTRYQIIFGRRVEAEERGVTFRDIIGWSRQADYSMVLLIDNYTAPLLRSLDARFQLAITRNILERLANLRKGGILSYGLLVGEELPEGRSWLCMPSIWRDLSDTPDFSEAIGFTHSEVVALGQALSVDLLHALQSSPTVDQRDNERLLYAPADVLTIARGLINADLPFPETLSVRTLAIPPPVEEVPLKTRILRGIEVLFGPGPWPDPVYEEIDIHTGFPHHDDDDGAIKESPNANDSYEAADSSWEGRRPALTIDGSSASSSPPSSSDSSAESASGGTKKPMLILGGLESPLLGHSRKNLEPEDNL